MATIHQCVFSPRIKWSDYLKHHALWSTKKNELKKPI